MVYCVFREVLLQYVKVEGIIPPGVSQIIPPELITFFLQIRRFKNCVFTYPTSMTFLTLLHYFFFFLFYPHQSTTFQFCETPTIFQHTHTKKEQFHPTFDRNIPLILVYTPFDKSRIRDENIVYLGSNNNRNRFYHYKYF